MAKLSSDQIREILTKAGRHPDIDGAKKEEARAKFHTEAALGSLLGGEAEKAGAVQNFLTWVKGLSDTSKYAIFQQLLTNPVSTIEVTESIFNEVLKIFEGQDRFVGYQ